MKDSAAAEIVALVVQKQKAFTALDVNGLFAMYVFARMPANRNLSLHQETSPGGKPRFGRDHERRLVVLPSAHPIQFFTSSYSGRFP